MAATRDQTVKRILRWLSDTPWQDKLTALIAGASATSVTINAPGKWYEGDILEIDDATGSLYLVDSQAADPSVNPLAVISGYLGTPDQGHSNGAKIRKNPRFPWYECSQAIDETIKGLFPSAWKVGTKTLTYVAGKKVYDLAADFEDLIAVAQVIGTSPSQSILFYGSRGSGFPVAVRYHVPTSLAASGNALEFTSWYNTSNIFVTYRSRYTAADLDAGNIDDASLLWEAIVMGSCYKLLAGEDAERTGDDTTQLPATDNEVASQLRDADWYRQRYIELLARVSLQLKHDAQRPTGVFR